MTPTFTERGQLLIDEAVRTHGDIVKPPWMQPIRLRTLNRELDRIRATMPAASTRTSEPIGLYDTERRAKWRGNFEITRPTATACRSAISVRAGSRTPRTPTTSSVTGPGP